MSRRRRVLEEEGGIVEVEQVPDELSQKYRVEVTWTEGVQDVSTIDEAIRAAEAVLENAPLAPDEADEKSEV